MKGHTMAKGKPAFMAGKKFGAGSGGSDNDADDKPNNAGFGKAKGKGKAPPFGKKKGK